MSIYTHIKINASYYISFVIRAKFSQVLESQTIFGGKQVQEALIGIILRHWERIWGLQAYLHHDVPSLAYPDYFYIFWSWIVLYCLHLFWLLTLSMIFGFPTITLEFSPLPISIWYLFSGIIEQERVNRNGKLVSFHTLSIFFL